MKTLQLFLALLLTTEAFAATAPVTWDELCYLLEAKRESKVFHEFSRECGLHEFGKRDGNYSGRDGIIVTCAGNDIVAVGVRVSLCTLKLPFGLEKEDNLYSAARKLGISPTEDQKNRAKEYLKVIDRQHRVVLDFMDGRLFTVWKQRANKPPLQTPASGTPAAGTPVAPPAGATGR
jgi:hypothetical protein